jgi:ferritin-like metal-binding protein YciE
MTNQLEAALCEQIKDLYSAESQLVEALPKLARAAAHGRLREGMEFHLRQTQRHVERLERAGEMLEMKLGGKKCVAMEGLIEEGNEAVKGQKKGPMSDALLIAGAQRIEHYEISGYGTARAMAEGLGLHKVAALLERTLEEEKDTDRRLSGFSERVVLPAAAAASEDEEDASGAGRGGGRSTGSGKGQNGDGRARGAAGAGGRASLLAQRASNDGELGVSLGRRSVTSGGTAVRKASDPSAPSSQGIQESAADAAAAPGSADTTDKGNGAKGKRAKKSKKGPTKGKARGAGGAATKDAAEE